MNFPHWYFQTVTRFNSPYLTPYYFLHIMSYCNNNTITSCQVILTDRIVGCALYEPSLTQSWIYSAFFVAIREAVALAFAIWTEFVVDCVWC